LICYESVTLTGSMWRVIQKPFVSLRGDLHFMKHSDALGIKAGGVEGRVPKVLVELVFELLTEVVRQLGRCRRWRGRWITPFRESGSGTDCGQQCKDPKLFHRLMAPTLTA
jgi:hypothetical protein